VLFQPLQIHLLIFLSSNYKIPLSNPLYHSLPRSSSCKSFSMILLLFTGIIHDTPYYISILIINFQDCFTDHFRNFYDLSRKQAFEKGQSITTDPLFIEYSFQKTLLIKINCLTALCRLIDCFQYTGNHCSLCRFYDLFCSVSNDMIEQFLLIVRCFFLFS